MTCDGKPERIESVQRVEEGTNSFGVVVDERLPTDQAKRVQYAKAWDQILAMVKTLWQSKVTLVCGTDNIGGLSLHYELELFVRHGSRS